MLSLTISDVILVQKLLQKFRQVSLSSHRPEKNQEQSASEVADHKEKLPDKRETTTMGCQSTPIAVRAPIAGGLQASKVRLLVACGVIGEVPVGEDYRDVGASPKPLAFHT